LEIRKAVELDFPHLEEEEHAPGADPLLREVPEEEGVLLSEGLFEVVLVGECPTFHRFL